MIGEKQCLVSIKKFAQYMLSGDHREFMNQLFFQLNRIYREDLVEEGNKRSKVIGYKYFKHSPVARATSESERVYILESDLPTTIKQLFTLDYIHYESYGEYCGTYVHPYLFQHVIIWASSEYAVKACMMMHLYTLHKSDLKEIEADRKHSEIIEGMKLESAKQKERHLELIRQNDTLHSSSRAIYEQLIIMNVKNDKLKNLILTLGDSITTLPITKVQKDTRSFDIVVKPPNRLTQIFLIISVVRIQSPIVKTHYTVNRVQWRNYKRQVQLSLERVLSRYNTPVYRYYYAFFESSASAVTAWNQLKETGLMKTNGSSELIINETKFDQLIKTLSKIRLSPEEEINILTKEYENLKETDKEFLAELMQTDSDLL